MNFRRRKSVVVASLLFAAVTVGPVACRTLDGPEASAESIDAIEPGDEADALLVATEPAPFTVQTYDGSGEFVHPDAYVFPSAWHGRRYWYAATPYPGGKSEFENPSVFRGTGGGWTPPAGVANPLARPEPSAYLSDPDITYDPVADLLRLYYRETTQTGDRVHLVTSVDGVHWSTPRRVLDAVRYGVISPAIVREDDGSWRMWSVDAQGVGCAGRRANVSLMHRRSLDGLAWGFPTPVRLDIPRYVAWHLDVQYVPAKQEYWALVAAYPDGSNCSYTAVFFGRSVDGITWRMSPSPLLAPGGLDPIRALVYRSTFHYHPASDAVSVWYSGARVEPPAYVYSGATARYPMTELLRRVEQPFDVDASVARTRVLAADPVQQAARAGFVREFP